ncbi:phage/plasmid replication protein [Gilliamella sp. BG7]|uniref:phage/plasmid replication domain-containing protein n=1 Tax=Gilliamella sp. BG7 TaxID=3351513 RepID=UPI0039877473
MDFETVAEQLIRCGVVDTTRSANTTAMYALQWMHGQTFDFRKSQVQIHRARLRKIGIDIAQRDC